MRFHTVVSAVAFLGAGISQVAWSSEPSTSPTNAESRQVGEWVPVEDRDVATREPVMTSDSDHIVASAPSQDAFPAIEPCGYTASGEACDGWTTNMATSDVCLSAYQDCGSLCSGQEDGMRLRRFDLAFVSSEVLFIGRDADDFRLVGTDGGTNFFEESLSHGFEPGFRLGLGLRLWGNGFVEARHARAGGWEATGDFQPLPGDPGAIAARGTFEADYHSTDINLVAEDPVHNEYQLLLGLRFIEHNDSFNATLNDSQVVPNVESYEGSADNAMFGVHAGFRTGWFYRRSVWSLNVLGGVLNNRIKQTGPRYATALVVDGVADPLFSIESEEVSIFADIEGSIAYPILPSTYVRVGYQGVFMDNVATVTRQAGSPDEPDAMEFHGGFVGLEFYR